MSEDRPERLKRQKIIAAAIAEIERRESSDPEFVQDHDYMEHAESAMLAYEGKWTPGMPRK